MAKLTRIALAKLIGFIERNHALNMSENQIQCIDDIIDIEVPEPIKIYPRAENIEALMKYMAEGTNKIDAIREHRALTGMGLKDSKDAVERYWVSKPVKQEYIKDHNIGDILKTVSKD